jgi:hypothetical protein
MMIAVAVLGGLVVAVLGLQWYLDTRDKRNQVVGEQRERQKWQAREISELAAANATILKLQAEVDALEKRLIKEVAYLETKHRREMRNAQKKKDRDVAAARAGALRLRVPVAGCSAPGESAGGRADGERPAAASGSDGTRTAQVSGEVTAVVVGIAHDADRLARKVTRLQDLVLVYYGACGKKDGPAASRGEAAGPGGKR